MKRRGIRSVLAADPTLDVVGEAADAEEALAKVQERLKSLPGALRVRAPMPP